MLKLVGIGPGFVVMSRFLTGKRLNCLPALFFVFTFMTIRTGLGLVLVIEPISL